MFKKKSLGQHFLNPNYVGFVADAANVKPGESVLEVGPGQGVLTRELLARGAHVLAVEKDARLIPLLKATFDAELHAKRLVLVEADALTFDPGNVRAREYKIVANIPYYITGALLRHFFSARALPNTIVVLTQKEVAERIAKSKKESLLSLSVKAYGKPEYIKTVPRGAFSPPPTVDSAILRVSNISRNNFTNDAHEKRFFELIHAGFAQKRKLMRRNLEVALGPNTPLYMQKVGIAPNARAEDVGLAQWLMLARN